ncbi:hypothetical protein VCR29J2_360772 [Vibrio coralliirubri]|nr:hypothetical protein VCR29J2_360772 [Vibrio coralliirubri]
MLSILKILSFPPVFHINLSSFTELCAESSRLNERKGGNETCFWSRNATG